MPRTVNFNMVIDKTRTDGGFASTSWWLKDPQTGLWTQLPPLPGNESDSVALQSGDVITFAIGEQLPNATTTAVSGITLAVVFGSRQMPNQANSPFQNAQGAPICLYVGNTGGSTPNMTPAWSSTNTNGGYFAWTLPVGTIPPQQQGPNKKFELMVGANVTFNDGTPSQSLGHDPEVDVGMGSN
jgi:hypothetical protein